MSRHGEPVVSDEDAKDWRVDPVTWRFMDVLRELAFELEDEATATMLPGGSREAGVAKLAAARAYKRVADEIDNQTWQRSRLRGKQPRHDAFEPKETK